MISCDEEPASAGFLKRRSDTRTEEIKEQRAGDCETGDTSNDVAFKCAGAISQKLDCDDRDGEAPAPRAAVEPTDSRDK